jgi:hypothetical protein
MQSFSNFCTAQKHTASLLTGCFLSFLPVYNCCTMNHIYHSHSCTITSLFVRNTECPFFKQLPSSSRSTAMSLLALTVKQAVTFLSSNVSANFSYKNCLDGCDNFGLSFCLKVIKLSPLTPFPQLSTSPILKIKCNTTSHTILASSPYYELNLDFMS